MTVVRRNGEKRAGAYKKDWQCSYSVLLNCYFVSIVAVRKQGVLNYLSVHL